MSKRAQRVSVLLGPGNVNGAPAPLAEALASHLLGSRPTAGERLSLPGWPELLVDLVEPKGSTVEPGTEIEINVPPRTTLGPLQLAVLVDASLTMGRGGRPTRFERTARLIDAWLLNGRGFIRGAGIVVQGGSTRQVEPLKPPEEVSGASILKVVPKGTFDLALGLSRAADLFAGASEGRRVILVVTDGSEVPRDMVGAARPALQAGAVVVAFTFEPAERLLRLCEATGGACLSEAEAAYHYLAGLAGTKADWAQPAEARPAPAEDWEFEVVIETMEDRT